ncbi:barwin-like endoglucanase, partial [Fomitiporia mediterranea MF3/22]|uniref:barwin-like endoglucanase n=1 Tax=Fomitiporia mediterranea (strain MF3/22) TaxID=694068 RepID=UPI0004407A14
AAAVSARVVPRKSPPAGWWTEGLEDYNAYHTRYLALGCQNFHGQAFFDQCCHPLKVNETLETARPPQCIPSASASASASLAEPTSTDDGDDDDDEDCEDDGDDNNSSAVSVPSSTKAPEPKSTPAPSPAQPSSSKSSSQASSTKTSSSAKSSPTSSSSGNVNTGGFATFYLQNGNQGACGYEVFDDSALIAAIDAQRYGDTGVVSDLCGKMVKITNTDNNKQVTVKIVDACPTCENGNSIDLSTGAFDQIADPSTGIVPISWEFV